MWLANLLIPTVLNICLLSVCIYVVHFYCDHAIMIISKRNGIFILSYIGPYYIIHMCVRILRLTFQNSELLFSVAKYIFFNDGFYIRSPSSRNVLVLIWKSNFQGSFKLAVQIFEILFSSTLIDIFKFLKIKCA